MRSLTDAAAERRVDPFGGETDETDMTEHRVARRDAREMDIAVASMRAERWDAP